MFQVSQVSPIAFRQPPTFGMPATQSFAALLPTAAPVAARPAATAPQGDPSRVLALMGANARLTLKMP